MYARNLLNKKYSDALPTYLVTQTSEVAEVYQNYNLESFYKHY